MTQPTLPYRIRKQVRILQAAVVCLSVALCFVLWQLNALGRQIDVQTGIVAKIKQPLEVRVYPQISQVYSGLPSWNSVKEKK